MFGKKTVTGILAIVFFVFSTASAQSLEDNWNDFLHYTKIGLLDLAAGYAQAVIDSNPDPVRMLELAEENPQGYAILLRVKQTAPNPEITALTNEILTIIEEGRFIRRTSPKIIAEEIRRLSSTSRAQLAAVKRLQNAGEYAISYMLDAMADNSRKDELPNIIWALPQIGKDAVRPLAAALQTDDTAVKVEIIRAMGKIGYPQSLAYLKYVAETEDSVELKEQARAAISEIDPAALEVPASQLFYRLAENYYYHAPSLAPAEDADFANIWFWDAGNRMLVREKVDRIYFYELMVMRACEWALKADAGAGEAIGLWLAAYFKAEAADIDMPDYFGPGHPDAMVYATTAGAEYIYQALARAIKDKDAYVALHAVQALAATAGQKALLYKLGLDQPLAQALSFDNRAVRYSAAIAIAAAGPQEPFAESKLVVENLAEALAQSSEGITENMVLWDDQMAESYALSAAEAMLKLAQGCNPAINLAAAQPAIINATKGDRPEQLRILAGQILARLDSSEAQRTLSAMALDETNDINIRLAAFDCLAVSAKLNANLLDERTIDVIYSLVGSQQTEPELRSAAAAAFGALNLPSQKVKKLILDQARS